MAHHGGSARDATIKGSSNCLVSLAVSLLLWKSNGLMVEISEDSFDACDIVEVVVMSGGGGGSEDGPAALATTAAEEEFPFADATAPSSK